MKKWFVLGLLCLLSYTSNAQEGLRIRNVLELQRQAWNRGDLESFIQGYWKSDSLLFVGSDGPSYGWQQTLNNYRKNYPGKAGMGQLSFDIKELSLIDPLNAFVLGAWSLKREKDEPKGYFTLWFRKISGDWVIVVDHSS